MFDEAYVIKLGLFVFFSPHIALALLPGIPVYAGVLWSIGVEEWFYMFWPWCARLNRRGMIISAVVVILTVELVRVFSESPFWRPIFHVLRLDCMAAGALMALLFHDSPIRSPRPLLLWLYRIEFQIGAYLFLLYTLLAGDWIISGPLSILYIFSLSIIVLNIGTNNRSLIKTEGRLLNRLGEFSFGIYCYNWITVGTATIFALLLNNIFVDFPVVPVLTVLAPVLTIVVAAASYQFIEKPFLNLKKRSFTRVVSMSQAPEPASRV